MPDFLTSGPFWGGLTVTAMLLAALAEMLFGQPVPMRTYERHTPWSCPDCGDTTTIGRLASDMAAETRCGGCERLIP
jgi:predicted RNA-binding Zn-ribbon protein involved in translation (DUF1610 family)